MSAEYRGLLMRLYLKLTAVVAQFKEVMDLMPEDERMIVGRAVSKIVMGKDELKKYLGF